MRGTFPGSTVGSGSSLPFPAVGRLEGEGDFQRARSCSRSVGLEVSHAVSSLSVFAASPQSVLMPRERKATVTVPSRPS